MVNIYMLIALRCMRHSAGGHGVMLGTDRQTKAESYNIRSTQNRLYQCDLPKVAWALESSSYISTLRGQTKPQTKINLCVV